MCIITVKRRKKMLTIPRVAQLRICGRLTSWLWNRLCLFISDKQKQSKKEGSLCGWWLGHWFYWNVLLMEHTQTSCINFQFRNIWFSVMKILWPDRKLLRERQKGKILFFSILFDRWKGSLSSTASFVYDPWDVTGSVDLSHVPIRFCSVNFLNSRLSLSPHSLPIKFKRLPSQPIFRLYLDPGLPSFYVAISVCECCLRF